MRYHSFTKRGKCFVYNEDSHAVYEITEELLKELKKFRYGKSVDTEALKIIEKMGLSNESFDPINKKEVLKVPITSISLNVAQLCNLSCIYCYGDGGEYGESGYMDQETARDAINWLMRESNDVKELGIVFFGGEPLLNFKLIKYIVNYAKEIAKNFKKTVRFSITTNGTLLTSEIITFLNEERFSVTISFDGDKEMQNKNRPYKSGKGSYDKILENVEKFLQSRNGKGVTARATITDYNMDLTKIRNKLKEIGFKSYGMAFASVPHSNDVIQVTGKSRKNIMNDIDTLASQTLYDIRNNKIVADKQFIKIVEMILKRGIKEYFCGVGRSYMSLSARGDIYPCHRFIGDSSMKLDNLANINVADSQSRYIKNTVASHSKCKTCFANKYCGGGCIHESMNTNGSMIKPDNNYCSEFRHQVELAMWLVNELTQEEKEKIAK